MNTLKIYQEDKNVDFQLPYHLQVVQKLLFWINLPLEWIHQQEDTYGIYLKLTKMIE